jgi:riboflavin biosynthesis pyrimidine reductase
LVIRFERLVDRKTREAVAAEIPPLRTVDAGDAAGLEPVGNTWSRRLFGGDFYVSPRGGAVPATSLVFVQSRDGNTGGRHPSALGGGEADKHLIYEGLSRVAADAVLAGARTVSGTAVVLSIWRPELVALRAALRLPRHPVQIVVTSGRLSFDDTLMLNVPELTAIVVAAPDYIDANRAEFVRRPWMTPIALGPAGLRGAFQELALRGVGRVSAIGGRTIARSLLAAGLVQDLYLTTSPRAGGEPGTPLSAEPLETTLVVRKRGTGPEDGVVFEHLRLASPPLVTTAAG